MRSTRSTSGSDPAPEAGRRAAPAPPTVAAELYDTDYYLASCAGHEDWVGSGGARADALYLGSLERARLRPGDTLVDIGTGRGELLAVAVQLGARRAVGIEYSADAVAIARRTLAAAARGDRVAVLAADARQVPLRSGAADLVTMLDVVEHLAPAELAAALREALRLLRPGGRLFAHTFPTRTLYQVTYRLHRLSRPGRRRRWPADPRNELERAMHVNEQTRRSLRRALAAAGFVAIDVRHGQWVYEDFVPDLAARALYHRLASHRLTRPLGVADLWAEAVAPGPLSRRS